MVQQNIVNVNFFGGIMSFFNSPRKRLENVIKAHNEEGYRTVFILPGNFNLFFAIVSLLVLVCTIFIYQPLPGYMVIFEKELK